MDTLFLRRIYWALERRIAPGLASSQYRYKTVLFEHLPEQGPAWLDLGCGHQVFGEWMKGEQEELLAKVGLAVGVDLDLAALRAHQGLKAKICGDLSAIPLRDDTFDVITANMVVEHLAEPEEVFREVHRLLRTTGAFLFHTTNAANPFIRAARILPQGWKNAIIYLLENRKAEDVFPTHYKVNRAAEVDAAAAKTGFSVERIEYVSTSAFMQTIPPLAVLELLFIRTLRRPGLDRLRTNLICVLRKEAGPAEA